MSPVLRTGISFAITVAIAYTSCALFFWLSPLAGMSLMSALFHGIDFSRLQASGAFDFSGFAAALVVITSWAFALGVLFGWLQSRPGENRTA